MKIADFFKEDLVVNNLDIDNKKDVINYLSYLLEEKGYGKKSKIINKLFWKREKEFSTGIGSAIAIPHLRNKVMNDSVVSFIKLKKPIEWESLDNKPVSYIFAIAIDDKESGKHMEILSSLSRLFMNDKFQKDISKVTDYKSLIKLLNTIKK